MDDVRSSEKLSTLRAITSVVREFAGSRIERELVVQAFTVVWDICESAPSSFGTSDGGPHSSSSGAVPLAPTSRVAEGVAA